MKIDQDTVMRLIREHFGEKLQAAVTFKRWKDGIDVDYPIYAIEAFAESVATAERERMAQMLTEMFMKAKPGPGRGAHAFAITAVRRGRLLTNAEQMENLTAAINDDPAPHPAPETAV